MKLATHLALGRVSNLPTVWTNVLAAGLVAGAGASMAGWSALVLAMSLFYVAGMYYNDACDAGYDREHQPHRPIASGRADEHDVRLWVTGYFSVGLLLVYVARLQAPLSQGSGSAGWLLAALALIGCIVAYDRHHKDNRFSPLLMGGCRVLVLVTSSYTLSASLPPMVWLAMLTLLAWLIGLTFIAKQEPTGSVSDQWPLALLGMPVLVGLLLGLSSPAVLLVVAGLVWVIIAAGKLIERRAIGQAIPLMIAGICLVDGLFMAHVWSLAGLLLAYAGFALTIFLQRWVVGT